MGDLIEDSISNCEPADRVMAVTAGCCRRVLQPSPREEKVITLEVWIGGLEGREHTLEEVGADFRFRERFGR